MFPKSSIRERYSLRRPDECRLALSLLRCLMGSCFTLLSFHGFAEPPRYTGGEMAPGNERYALLGNGRVIEGRITRTSREVAIERASGTKIVLDGTQVLATGGSQEALHRYWIDHRPHREADPLAYALYLLDEADWCLQNDLVKTAKGINFELQQIFASAKFPNSLYVRLRSQTLRLDRYLASSSNRASGPVRLMPASNAQPLLDRREAYFSSFVTPILNNQCLDCHRKPTTIALSLVGTHQAGRLSDSDLRENIDSIEDFIETDRPANETSFYRASSQPHGGQRHASLTRRNTAALAHLATWIEMSQQDLQEREITQSAATSIVGHEGLRSGLRQASANLEVPEKQDGKSRPSPSTRIQRLPVVENPHDAAIFNRMHHGHRF
ncbi:MAG: hypothetical protein AAF664_12610 [Planctomycetota bacterium]